jgi:hypothetical protein
MSEFQTRDDTPVASSPAQTPFQLNPIASSFTRTFAISWTAAFFLVAAPKLLQLLHISSTDSLVALSPADVSLVCRLRCASLARSAGLRRSSSQRQTGGIPFTKRVDAIFSAPK